MLITHIAPPKGIDENVIKEWTGKARLIKEYVNDGNYCLLVKHQAPGRPLSEKEPGTVQFLRFFTVGSKTHCSVDYDSDNVGMTEKLGELLNEKLGK